MGLEVTTHTGETVWVVDKEHTRMTFSDPADATRNYLQTLKDAQGNTATYAYASRGKISQITDGVGRVTVFSYNSAGQLSTIAAPGCVTVSYSYDSANRLTGVSYSDLTATQKTVYSYTDKLLAGGRQDGS